MLKKRLLLVISIVILCINAAPAMADLWLYLDIDQTQLSYTKTDATSGTGNISLQSNARLYASLWNDVTKIDSAEIDNTGGGAGVFSFSASLNFTKVGTNDWDATGTISMTELGGINTRISANFTSGDVPGGTVGDIYLEPIPGGYSLNIDGFLIPTTPPAILVGASSGNAWTFKGETENISPVKGSDGVANQITVQPWEPWSYGEIVSFHYATTASTLDAFFSNNATLTEGDIDITIVPAPVAVVLCMMGLGVVGWKLRKYA